MSLNGGRCLSGSEGSIQPPATRHLSSEHLGRIIGTAGTSGLFGRAMDASRREEIARHPDLTTRITQKPLSSHTNTMVIENGPDPCLTIES